MNKIDKDSIEFIFMMKEYEMFHASFDRHSKAVEKSITFFWIFIGAMVSLQGLIYEQPLSLFRLTGLQLLLLGAIVVLGGINTVNIIEHRILYITYVKSINLTRKWFLDQSEDTNLGKYLFFEPRVDSPAYFKWKRHFFWETLGVILIESMLLSLWLTNVLIEWASRLVNSISIKLIIFIFFCVICLLLGMYFYKLNLNNRDKDLRSKIGDDGLLKHKLDK